MEKTPIYGQTLLWLQQVALENQTPYDVQDHPRYGWTSFSYQTDKFGGDYLNLGIRYDGLLFNTDKPTMEHTITLGEVRAQVPKLKAEMLKNRDLSKVDEFINEQYD